MKCLVLLSLCALSLAKPQGKLVTETEGRIIGGDEAPKRKLRTKISEEQFSNKIISKEIILSCELTLSNPHSDKNFSRRKKEFCLSVYFNIR